MFQGSNLPSILEHSRLTIDVELEPLMQKDSADITSEDRELILNRSVESEEDKIIVTHGTDTMVETARYLGEKGVGDKTVVLVGSFVPFSQEDSDAFFNLGYSFSAVQQLPAGVWVCMGGESFEWNKVKKNMEQQLFEPAD